MTSATLTMPSYPPQELSAYRVARGQVVRLQGKHLMFVRPACFHLVTPGSLEFLAPEIHVSSSSALVLGLRPDQFMLFEGCQIEFLKSTTVRLLDQARFVFGAQFMPEAQANTPLRRSYRLLQQAYAGLDEGREVSAMLFAASLQHLSPADRGLVCASLEIGAEVKLLQLLGELVSREEQSTVLNRYS